PSKQIAERLADVLAVVPDDKSAFVTFARRVTDTLPVLPIEPNSAAPSIIMPKPSTPFIGRERELAQIAKRLFDPACGLLTLVGPGGIGKTRLALQAAEQQVGHLADGVYFVSLAPVNFAHQLASTISSALGFMFYGSELPAIQLLNYLRTRALLLVLDN